MTNFLSHQSAYKIRQHMAFSLIQSQHKRQISRHLFSKTPYSRRDYTELELFRQQIELNQEGLHHQPYTANKSGVKIYKSIFYGFACLFIFLGLFVMATTSTFTYAFFNFTVVLKTFITLICALLALASLIMAITLRTEREAVIYYSRSAKANLAKLYARKKAKLGIKRFLAFLGHPLQEANALKQMYHEAYDKINERKEETLHLVDRINSTSSIDIQTKETLYNQAVAEFNDKLTLLVHTFKHSSFSH
jgi:hypothetical protein